MGLLLAGANAAAVDRVAVDLMRYRCERLPIVREAFGRFRWPLAPFAPEDVTLVGDLGSGTADTVLRRRSARPEIVHPEGWIDAACDADGRVAAGGAR